MKYFALLLKSPFIALKWAILLPLIIVVMVIDRFTSGGCSAFLNGVGQNASVSGASPSSSSAEDSDDSSVHFAHRDFGDSGFASDSGPAFNIDGTPMFGDTDIHGNSFGMTGGFDNSCSLFDDCSPMFEDSFSSCGSSCFDD
jgi:hypothetical protein